MWKLGKGQSLRIVRQGGGKAQGQLKKLDGKKQMKQGAAGMPCRALTFWRMEIRLISAVVATRSQR